MSPTVHLVIYYSQSWSPGELSVLWGHVVPGTILEDIVRIEYQNKSALPDDYQCNDVDFNGEDKQIRIQFDSVGHEPYQSTSIKRNMV